jgi:arylsulfatase A
MRVAAACLAMMSLLLAFDSLASKPESPNFILVLTDDQGWTSMSAAMDFRYPIAQSDYHRTPALEAIAAAGMRFSSAYSASPVCSPSRYSIQFGKSPARLGRTRVLGENQVDHNQVAIPQVLKKANASYQAAHLGKWHIDADPSRYLYDVHDGQTTNKEGGYDNDQKAQWRGYSETDPKRVFSLTERAIAFIQASVAEESPFFLQLSHYALHSNIVYREESYTEIGEASENAGHTDRGYAAMVADLDTAIGQLWAAYNRLGLKDSTYFIITSDNGGMPVLPQQVNKGRPYKKGLNSPLLRGKWDLMEGGIRVPFLVVGPDVPAGSQADEPIIGSDLLPTFADLAGAHNQLPTDLDGISIRALLSDPSKTLDRPSDGLIFHFPHYNAVGLNEPHSAIRVKDFKLVRFHSSQRSLLFNIENDIGEQFDLSSAQPKKAAELELLLESYLEQVDAERPEQSISWIKPGANGQTRTRFLERYPKQGGEAVDSKTGSRQSH